MPYCSLINTKGCPTSAGALQTLPPPPEHGLSQPRRWPTILALVVFFPIGLLMMWLGNAFERRTKITVTAIFGFLFLLGILSPSDDSIERASSRSGETNRAERKHAQAKTTAKVKQFEDFRLGDFSYQIQMCEIYERIGRRPFSETLPTEGALFLVINYTIVNESNKTKTVLSDDFLIRDSKGREFRPSAKVNTALLMSERNKDFILSELQPGLSTECMSGFELPLQSLASDLTLIVMEKGILGSKKVEVSMLPNHAPGEL